MTALDFPLRSFSLAGRVALVTGASRGLGFEIARALAQAGAFVHVNGRDAANAADAVRLIRADGGAAERAVFDIGSQAEADRVLREIVATHGRLDILVNNVGVRRRAAIEDITAEEFRTLLDVNLVAAYSLSKQATALMKPRGFGRIINLSSVSSLAASPGDAAYIAAKGALNALTRALACEWGRYGVTCNAIAPGGFRTETNRTLWQNPASLDVMKQRAPLQRWGEPHEIAGAAVFLASEAASYVTGTVLVVDGGCTAAF